jgi:hypothetical protein
MSRFVDDDPIKVNSPVRLPSKPAAESAPPCLPKAPVLPPTTTEETKTVIESEAADQSKEDLPKTHVADELPKSMQVAKSGSKRKYGVSEGQENVKTSRPIAEATKPRIQSEKHSSGLDRQNGKTLKEIASIRREARERLAASTNTRKPLAAKSTNDDISSPKKTTKVSREESAIAKVDITKVKEARSLPKVKLPEKEMPATAQPAGGVPPRTREIVAQAEPVPQPAQLQIFSPGSPAPSAAVDGPRDTPPPADISSMGETIRPSRRARASVSYAEPNLRDKMRRPTKELLDAVAGEGKYIRNHQASDEPLEGSNTTKRESDASELWKSMPKARELGVGSSAKEEPKSPLADKGPSPDDLPSNVVTHRRKRTSSVSARESLGGSLESIARSLPAGSGLRAEGEGRSQKGDPRIDLYDFASSSPFSEKMDSSYEEKASTRPQTKLSRRHSSVMKEDVALRDDKGDIAERPRSAVSRKRPSMVPPKRSRMADDDEDDDPSYSYGTKADADDGGYASERSAMRRRRSMMI